MFTIERHFAWWPTKVRTWRRSTATVWLQTYYHKKGEDIEYTCFGASMQDVDYYFCLYIGIFSREINFK